MFYSGLHPEGDFDCLLVARRRGLGTMSISVQVLRAVNVFDRRRRARAPARGESARFILPTVASTRYSCCTVLLVRKAIRLKLWYSPIQQGLQVLCHPALSLSVG
jgi:hypothetical protein